MPRGRRKSAVYEDDYRFIIRRVHEARQAAGMTQIEVATAPARPISFVSKCELGERRIDPVDLRDFAELYDKPLAYFYPIRTQRARKGKA